MYENKDFNNIYNYLVKYFNKPIKNIVYEKENREYNSTQFNLDELLFKYREARITPTKLGMFVTFYKRNKSNITIPYDVTDTVDFLVIGIKNSANFGCFIFTKKILLEKDIMSKNNIGGKRGFRVYPPFEKVTSTQAIKTQSWQVEYYKDLSYEK